MVKKFQNIHFREFLIWSALYTLISISYRHLARSHPDSELKTSFDQFCLQVNRFTGKESPNIFFLSKEFFRKPEVAGCYCCYIKQIHIWNKKKPEIPFELVSFKTTCD